MAPARQLLITLGVLVLLSLSGCEQRAPRAVSPSPAPFAPLRVLAAASLADAFREAGAAFEAAHPATKVEFSFAGSNQLRTQLENGGPGDVFASADRKQMDAAVASKVVDPATIRVFAINRLALIVPSENRAGITSLADLARPGLKIVVADKSVPAGNYTLHMLEAAGQDPRLGLSFVNGFNANIVSREQNVAAVAAKVALNEADAGIAYASDASGSNSAKLHVFPLPDAVAQNAEYIVATTVRAGDAALASRFIEYLQSPDAVAIIVRRGFLAPRPEPK